MYYCRYGLSNQKLGIFLGAFFAICGGITAPFWDWEHVPVTADRDGGLPTVRYSPWIMGLVISVSVGLVILGGIKRIGAVAARLVPLMIVFYFAGPVDHPHQHHGSSRSNHADCPIRF